MASEWVLPGVAVAAVVVYGVLIPRWIRRMRHGDEDWRRRWQGLDRDRRAAIAVRLRRGEAVEDPVDAELALRAVAQLGHVRAATRPVNLVSYATIAGLLALGAAGAHVILFAMAPLLIFGAVTGVLSRRRWARYQRAAEATRRALGEH